MSLFKLKLELTSHSDIKMAFEEAVALADKLEIIIEFVSYGVLCTAYPGTDASVGVMQFEANKNATGGKFASTKVF